MISVLFGVVKTSESGLCRFLSVKVSMCRSICDARSYNCHSGCPGRVGATGDAVLNTRDDMTNGSNYPGMRKHLRWPRPAFISALDVWRSERSSEPQFCFGHPTTIKLGTLKVLRWCSHGNQSIQCAMLDTSHTKQMLVMEREGRLRSAITTTKIYKTSAAYNC